MAEQKSLLNVDSSHENSRSVIGSPEDDIGWGGSVLPWNTREKSESRPHTSNTTTSLTADDMFLMNKDNNSSSKSSNNKNSNIGLEELQVKNAREAMLSLGENTDIDVDSPLFNNSPRLEKRAATTSHRKKKLVKKPFETDTYSSPLLAQPMITMDNTINHFSSVRKLPKREIRKSNDSKSTILPQVPDSPKEVHKLIYVNNQSSIYISQSNNPQKKRSTSVNLDEISRRKLELSSVHKRTDDRLGNFALRSSRLTLDEKRGTASRNKQDSQPDISKEEIVEERVTKSEENKEIEKLEEPVLSVRFAQVDTERKQVPEPKDLEGPEKLNSDIMDLLYDDHDAEIYRYSIHMDKDGRERSYSPHTTRAMAVLNESEALKRRKRDHTSIFHRDKVFKRSLRNAKSMIHAISSNKEKPSNDISYLLEEEMAKLRKSQLNQISRSNMQKAVKSTLQQVLGEQLSSKNVDEAIGALNVNIETPSTSTEELILKLPEIKNLVNNNENDSKLQSFEREESEYSIVDEVLKAVSRQTISIPKTKIPKEYFVIESSPLITRTELEKEVKYNVEDNSWQTKIFPSNKPGSRVEVIHLAKTFEAMLKAIEAQNIDEVGSLKAQMEVIEIISNEIVRQVYVTCAERGVLIQQVLAMMQEQNKTILKWHQDAMCNTNKQRDVLKDKNETVLSLQYLLREKDEKIHKHVMKIDKQNSTIASLEAQVKQLEKKVQRMMDGYHVAEQIINVTPRNISKNDSSDQVHRTDLTTKEGVENEINTIGVEQVARETRDEEVQVSGAETRSIDVDTDFIEGMSLESIRLIREEIMHLEALRTETIQRSEEIQEIQIKNALLEAEKLMAMQKANQLEDKEVQTSSISQIAIGIQFDSPYSTPLVLDNTKLTISVATSTSPPSSTPTSPTFDHTSTLVDISMDLLTPESPMDPSNLFSESLDETDKIVQKINSKLSPSPVRKKYGISRSNPTSVSPSTRLSPFDGAHSRIRKTPVSCDLTETKRRVKEYKFRKLKLEEVDQVFIEILDAKKPDARLQSLRWVNRLILDIFSELTNNDFLSTVNELRMVRRFIYDFHLVKFGLPSIALNHLAEFLFNVNKKFVESIRIQMFCNFCYMAEWCGQEQKPEYTLATLQFYLRVLHFTKVILNKRALHELEEGALYVSTAFIMNMIDKMNVPLLPEELSRFTKAMEAEADGNYVYYDSILLLLVRTYHEHLIARGERGFPRINNNNSNNNNSLGQELPISLTINAGA